MIIETHKTSKEKRMPRGGYRGGHRQKLPPEEKAVTMAIVVAPDVRDELRAMAKARGVSISSIVQEYIRRGMAQDARAANVQKVADLSHDLEDTERAPE